jgi:hypothetical protein
MINVFALVALILLGGAFVVASLISMAVTGDWAWVWDSLFSIGPCAHAVHTVCNTKIIVK